ncbi:MAG: amino acid adenylation domain-containing protein [Vicinamibacterales bacterium]
MHEFFDRAAAAGPERTAVDVPPDSGRSGRVTVSYATLARASHGVARALVPLVGPSTIVAIIVDRGSWLLYAAQLGVLRAGAAYTCIDPSTPDGRVREILADAECRVVVADARARPGLADIALEPTIVDVAAVVAGADTHPTPEAEPPAWLTSDSAAYVIYTSGTTGRPKGVVIEHRAIANLVASDLRTFALTPAARVAQCSSPAYDSSIEETYLAFAAGATLVVMDEEVTRLGPDLVPWLARERITVLGPPPTLLRATGCDDPEHALPELALLYVGGEALPRDLADRWARGRRLVNGYGPTECAVTSLRAEVRPGEPITIGVPVDGICAWVLDERGEVARDGEPGELCLGGVGLAREYWRQPALTAERFPTHPTLGRIYRTGDAATRGADGRFTYHGRLDTQVKIRGHRVELEEIEARLAATTGVREAACAVQERGAVATLVAYVVASDPATPPESRRLRAELARVLPPHMVPTRFVVLERLPTSLGGKLDRTKLGGDGSRERTVARPRDAVENTVAEAFARVLGGDAASDLDADFFVDLGGNSLAAAEVVSTLRRDMATSAVAVRDVYDAPTIASLAGLLRGRPRETAASPAAVTRPSGARPLLVTLAQASWLCLGLVVGGLLAYWTTFDALPFASEELGLVHFLLVAPALFFGGALVYAAAAIALAVVVKWTVIGRYRPGREPIWGTYYLRHWIVHQTARLIPWDLLGGTVLQHAALRALGARVGRRVHIGRGVNLALGGWDLLELGDEASIGQDAMIRLVDYERGAIVVGPVVVGARATVEVRAALAGHSCLGPDAYLSAFSSVTPGTSVPAGERWDGVPAQRAGVAPEAPTMAVGRPWSPWAHAGAMLLATLAMVFVLAAPLDLAAVAFAMERSADATRLWTDVFDPAWNAREVALWLSVLALSAPLALLLEAAVVRAMGRVPVGVIDRWSVGYVRVWLKTGAVRTAGDWLSGTLFWPAWLRLAGMRLGPQCEISGIIDVVPEHVTIGARTFFADGIYLGGPRVHRGTVSVRPTVVGHDTFVGNHAVIPCGETLEPELVLGVCTVANAATMPRGTAWFGRPAFELPRRETVEMDRRLTHDPSPIRYLNRVLWELARFALPLPIAVVQLAWVKAIAAWAPRSSSVVLLGVAVPGATLAAAGVLCTGVLGLKWLLLGRVRPGRHALWSCWCSRWDFVYVAWAFLARPALAGLEGTLAISWFLRAMGARIGRRVALVGAFAQVVDPDMLVIDDDATVECQFQAHTFEDRVLKIDRIHIRRGASAGSGTVPLYGADIGVGTTVLPDSVVMKGEHLVDAHTYVGCPSRALTSTT